MRAACLPIPAICSVMSLALLTIAISGYVVEKSSAQSGTHAVTIDRSKLDELLESALPPGDHEFVVRFHNPTDRMQRVIGFTPACGLNCCVTEQQELPLVIPARSSADLLLNLHVAHYGKPLNNKATKIFLEDGGHFREYELSVVGTAMAQPALNR